MTTWGQLRDLLVQRLSEYSAGAAEAAAGASFSDATLYYRLTLAYRDMLDEIAKRDPQKITSLSSFAYASGTESLALAAGLKYRPIFGIERLLPSGDYEPLEQLEQYQDERSRMPFSSFPLSTSYMWMGSTFGYKLEGGTLLYVLPKPQEDLTLRARYQADVADVTAANVADTPAFIPSEHLSALALYAALTFLREVGGNATLEAELALVWPRFLKWAASSPKRGPRFVLETQ